jgi:hypothetical protein
MADRDEGFLSRWSRLKQDERDQKSVAAVEENTQEETSPVTTVTVPDVDPPAETEDPNADLPPIESLDKDSDYTVFLRAGVAPELRKQALGKLWRSDPVFANLDGLLEYGEDFSLPFKNRTAVATLYQVGKGMMEAVLRESPPADEASPDETVAELPAAENTVPPQVDSAIAKRAPHEAANVTEAQKEEKV